MNSTRIRYNKQGYTLTSDKYVSGFDVYQVTIEKNVLKIVNLSTGDIIRLTEETNVRSAQRRAKTILQKLGIKFYKEIRKSNEKVM